MEFHICIAHWFLFFKYNWVLHIVFEAFLFNIKDPNFNKNSSTTLLIKVWITFFLSCISKYDTFEILVKHLNTLLKLLSEKLHVRWPSIYLWKRHLWHFHMPCDIFMNNTFCMSIVFVRALSLIKFFLFYLQILRKFKYKFNEDCFLFIMLCYYFIYCLHVLSYNTYFVLISYFILYILY